MPRRRPLGAVALSGLTLAVIAGCSGDDGGAPTMATFASSSSEGDATTSASAGSGAGPDDGYVRVQVRLGATGTDEVIDLDRASLEGTRDPVGLDARCTALDGGAGFTVSVVDLRRVSAGDRLVSASLRVAGEVSAAGTFDGSIDVADTRQVMTSYSGTVVVDAGLTSGTFDMADANGQVATGSFSCAEAAPVESTTTTAASTTTTIPLATS